MGPKEGKGMLFSAWPKATQQRPQTGSFYRFKPKSHFKPRCLVRTQTTGKWPSWSSLYSTHPPLCCLLFPGLRCRSASNYTASTCTTPYARAGVSQPKSSKVLTMKLLCSAHGLQLWTLTGSSITSADHLQKIIWAISCWWEPPVSHFFSSQKLKDKLNALAFEFNQ